MTVDITALREECVKWVDETLPGLINTRQPRNGDVGDFMAFDMAVIFKTWVHLSGKIEAAQARIAELESEQEPVAFMYHDRLHEGPRFSEESKIGNWSDDDIRAYGITETILYAAPTKPVVVLPKFPEAISSFVSLAMQAVRRMDIQAMQEAGIAVKDGE